MIRVLAFLTVLSLIGAARPLVAWVRRRDDATHVPEEGLGGFAVPGAARTWVVFTTPYCATCGPLMDEIERVRPDDGLVGVDATEHPDLTRRLGVRSSPTVFQIDADGRIIDRMIGTQAARAHLFGAGLAPIS